MNLYDIVSLLVACMKHQRLLSLETHLHPLPQKKLMCDDNYWSLMSPVLYVCVYVCFSIVCVNRSIIMSLSY